jgi:hypothetical protein
MRLQTWYDQLLAATRASHWRIVPLDGLGRVELPAGAIELADKKGGLKTTHGVPNSHFGVHFGRRLRGNALIYFNKITRRELLSITLLGGAAAAPAVLQARSRTVACGGSAG